ncbi:hypothetical protein P691DRAFT_764572 [Macrolepiota fuliginosa MF-IS2]|uniref:Uncharacterized protein n=1 Tax=Macrolepiota fuliginosa MF-IS2 TaxID=1400762 RepID=A0A9P6BZ28_9AGAR|nr:hypothetical protein P691DRAFT_764572 [Macrolepiota fuliginosa MF-IS2]
MPNYDNVNIHWVPEGDDSRLDVLQEELLSLAQRGCVRLLSERRRSRWNSLKDLLVNDTELINTFRSIHPVLFHANETLTKEFMSWVNECILSVSPDPFAPDLGAGTRRLMP